MIHNSDYDTKCKYFLDGKCSHPKADCQYISTCRQSMCVVRDTDRHNKEVNAKRWKKEG